MSRYTILACLLALPLAFLVGCPTGGSDDDDSVTDDDDAVEDDDDSVMDDDDSVMDDDDVVDDDDIVDDDDSVVEPCVDDALEDNDEEADASVIVPPVTDLLICPDDHDWYELTVAEGHWTLTVAFVHTSGDIDATLWGPDGSIGSGVSFSDNEVFDWEVPAGGQTYTLDVRYYGGGDEDEPGNSYEIQLAEYVPPTCDPDDSFEPNDEQASPSAITAGTHTGLKVCEFDADWYSIDLAEGDEITVEAVFTDDTGDIDMWLYDPAAAEVGEADSASDNETLGPFTVPTGGAGTHVIYVELYLDDDTIGQTYDLTVTVVTAGGGT